MKPSSIYQDAEMTLRFDNLMEYHSLHNRTEMQRKLIKIAEQRAKIASCFFTDNLEWIKDEADWRPVLERLEYMRKDFEGG